MRTEQTRANRSGVMRCACGFTLVELLVVIGIIALLIAILMPALAHARQQAIRTACAAKLQQIVTAAQLHRSDHRDYYPLVGVLPGLQPQNLEDADAARYDYLSNYFIGINTINYPRRLASITHSLAYEMSYKSQLFVANQTAAPQ